MSNAAQTHCLFLDPGTATDVPTQRTAAGFQYFELAGVERLTNRDGTLSRAEAEDADPRIQLELIHNAAQRALLLAVEPRVRATVNGLGVGRFSVLNPGDVLGIDEHVMHVSLLNRPYIGTPDASHLDAKCGYCRVAIQDEPDMRVYVCPNCNLPTHFHSEEVLVEKRLECAKLSSHCGHCQRDIVQEEGFTYVPTL